MDHNGGLFFRYLNPDGSQPQEELPVDVSVHTSTSIFNERYKLYENRRGASSRPAFLKNVINNLKFLSDNNPILLEEFLVFCETMPEEESPLVAAIAGNMPLVPTGYLKADDVYSHYRVLMETSAFLVELVRDGYKGDEDRWSRHLFNHARRSVDAVDHPCFKAAALANWIMYPHIESLSIIGYQDHTENIEFIRAHFDDVYEARHVIQGAGCIGTDYLLEVLQTTPSLRAGAL